MIGPHPSPVKALGLVSVGIGPSALDAVIEGELRYAIPNASARLRTRPSKLGIRGGLGPAIASWAVKANRRTIDL